MVATGLADGFVRGNGPTRSNALDVALSLDMGARAFLLTDETTVGHQPEGAVDFVRRVAGSWLGQGA